uniref:Uncharacterized protein n=1 Tax=Rhodosorus marinus TaxID=101924 RepID=A0A7S2ZZ06_9RHOD
MSPVCVQPTLLCIPVSEVSIGSRVSAGHSRNTQSAKTASPALYSIVGLPFWHGRVILTPFTITKPYKPSRNSQLQVSVGLRQLSDDESKKPASRPRATCSFRFRAGAQKIPDDIPSTDDS